MALQRAYWEAFIGWQFIVWISQNWTSSTHLW